MGDENIEKTETPEVKVPSNNSMEDLVKELQRPFEMKVAEPAEVKQEELVDTQPDKGEGNVEKEEPKVEEKGKTSNADVLNQISKFGGKDLAFNEDKKEGSIKEKETGVKDKVQTSGQTPGSQGQNQKGIARDYSGFNEQEAALLGRMSNEAFNYAAPILREHASIKQQLMAKETEIKSLKEGKVTIPDNYYDNPDAVVLTPEFNAAQENYMGAQQEHNWWAAQLVALEKGDNWQDLTVDPKTGQKFQGKIYEPSPEARAHIMRNLSSAQQMEFKRQGELEKVISGFQTQHARNMEKVAGFERTLFPWFEDKEGEPVQMQNKVAAELKKHGLSEKNPVFTSLAKSIALNFILRDALQAAHNQVGQTQVKKEDKQKAGPTGAEINGKAGGSGTGAAGPKKLSYSEMEQMMRG